MNGLMRRIFDRVTFSEGGEMPPPFSLCHACGSFVGDQPAHRRWHESMEALARTADNAETAANSARSMARRGGW